jgi:hypothetical protein
LSELVLYCIHELFITYYFRVFIMQIGQNNFSQSRYTPKAAFGASPPITPRSSAELKRLNATNREFLDNTSTRNTLLKGKLNNWRFWRKDGGETAPVSERKVVSKLADQASPSSYMPPAAPQRPLSPTAISDMAKEMVRSGTVVPGGGVSNQRLYALNQVRVQQGKPPIQKTEDVAELMRQAHASVPSTPYYKPTDPWYKPQGS